ncbi:hypothetical protein BC833DRAFT_407832 [Globomyces pollinis-pini]|nr:hypothetical protein BC833DRAFT_407832 [Globomyces pollinis-pini]
MNFLLLAWTVSASFVQLQWIDSPDCTSPPSVMYTFNLSNPNVEKKPVNETWPKFYEFAIKENPKGICGSAPVEFEDQCCISSLALSESNNFHSGSSASLPSDSSIDYPVKEYGDSGNYCVLNGPKGLFGYNSIYLLNDGQCVDNFKCASDSSLTVFSSSNCQGAKETFQLTKTGIPITFKFSNTSTSFVGKMLAGENKSIKVSWVTRTPSTNATPNTFADWDLLVHICFTLAILGDFGIAYHIYSRKYRKSQTYYMKLLFATAIVWICTDILNALYAYVKFESLTSQYVFIEFLWLFQNMATLLNVFQTTQFLFLVMTPTPSKRLKIGIYATLFILQIVFAGSKYFGYCWQPFIDMCVPLSVITSWMAMYRYWILIMFLWNTLPTTYLALRFFYSWNNSWLKSLKQVYDADKSFIILLFQQFLLAITYFYVSYLQNSTIFLGGDKPWDAMIAVQALLLTSHGITNVLLLQRLGMIVKKGNSSGTNTTNQQSHQQSIFDAKVTNTWKDESKQEIVKSAI